MQFAVRSARASSSLQSVELQLFYYYDTFTPEISLYCPDIRRCGGLHPHPSGPQNYLLYLYRYYIAIHSVISQTHNSRRRFSGAATSKMEVTNYVASK